MLYLDMDGCFADFAEHVSKRVNDLLTGEEVTDSKTMNRALRFFEREGIVRVDKSHFSHVSISKMDKKVARQYKAFIYRLAASEDFFRKLKVMNHYLFRSILETRIPFSFLTAPVGEHSCQDKKWWVQNILGVTSHNTPQFDRVICCPRIEKSWHAAGNVLFDDHPTTVREWKEAGGTAFLCPDEITTDDGFLQWLKDNK